MLPPGSYNDRVAIVTGGGTGTTLTIDGGAWLNKGLYGVQL